MSDIVFNPLDFIDPQGSNSLSSLALYYQRLLYKEKIYPSELVAPLDTWYDKQFYGRVDPKQNTITPRSSLMTNFEGALGTPVYAFRFVVDAFRDLAAHMEQATTIGVCHSDGNSVLTAPAPKAGFVPVARAYNTFLLSVFERFMQTFPPTTPKIMDFPTFVAKFVSFLKKVAASLPVTETNYILTNQFNPFSSGLSLSIAKENPSEDSPKYNDYIADPNFDFYVKSAKKFGFSVNKNMPWILTMDLFTNASLKYISKYKTAAGDPLDQDNFFDAAYDRVCYTDIEKLRLLITNSYEGFLMYNPFYDKISFRCNRPYATTVYRAPIGAPDTVVTDKYMLDLYLELRGLESKNSIQITQKLKNELANIYHLRPNKSLDSLNNGVDYINMIYRDYIYDVTYPSINDIINFLDSGHMRGTITTVGSIATELY